MTLTTQPSFPLLLDRRPTISAGIIPGITDDVTQHHIFTRLSAGQLVRHCALVCRRWNQHSYAAVTSLRCFHPMRNAADITVRLVGLQRLCTDSETLSERALAQLSWLTHLDFQPLWGRISINGLLRLPRLRSLCLQTRRISAIELSRLTNLESLAIRSGMSDFTSHCLVTMTSLRNLSIARATRFNIIPAHLSGLPFLSSLKLSNPDKSTVMALTSLTQLQSLTLTPLFDTGRSFPPMPFLTELKFYDMLHCSSMDFLRVGFSDLKVLHIICPILPVHIDSACFAALTFLIELVLYITIDELARISLAFASLANLQTLSIRLHPHGVLLPESILQLTALRRLNSFPSEARLAPHAVTLLRTRGCQITHDFVEQHFS